ncbi:beta-lactamase family protein [Qipengyuania sp. 6B39]|uniref:serine hydrolase domain-containing protein n=1 Tax=Qipengyuania proteolytica TaxID=2867239 RepID=UPI001C89DF1B|nr:serine hydrolase domain-containing protein [Qipengyuania proteolytica]MBX7495174.1 beta-lactamase family protein [Qipengyuania proteolytica]
MFELAEAAAQGFDAERLARIAPFLSATYVDGGRLPNAQLVVARNGQPVHYTKLGVMGDDGQTLRDDALFRIASMTKPITSIAFMQLVEQCKVALEEPVTRVFPEFANLHVYAGGGGSIPFAPGAPAHPMRFVDLLTHMSGLTYGLQNRNNIDAVYREHNFDFARDHLDSDEFIARLAKLPLEFAPGQGWNYSVSTDVLGIAVERISGMRLGEYFEQHIFAPLGMHDTRFGVKESDLERLVDAYAYRPGQSPRMISAGATSKLGQAGTFDSGGGGLVGTIADYHRFATMLLNGGELDGARIVSPKTLRLMRTNHLPNNADLTEMSSSLFSEANNAGTGFGLGFAMVIDPAKTLMPSSLGEFYWGGAYSTAFFVDPVEQITCVFMTQVYPSSTYPIRRQLKTLIYSALTESYAS